MNRPRPIAQLDGRRALVTGACSGIGLAVARELSACGAELILNDLNESVRAVAAELPRARGIPGDLASRAGVKMLAAEAGEIDILVNNAGLQHVCPIEDFPEAEWDRLLAVMLTAPFLLTQRLLPGMYARDWGRIVNIASVHAQVASPFKAAYVSAKHAILGLTRTVALEAAVRSQNITANAVCPSYVRTPLVERQIASQARTHGISDDAVLENVLLARNAIKRLIEPEDVAASVAFLCRDEAWSITGAAFPMDAGRLAH
jgi:3-hydroxybutyrate dehydrogenase